MNPISRLRPLAVSALVLALAACASSKGLAPQGQLVDAGSLHAEQSLQSGGLTPAQWPASDWWRALGDPQLDALIAEGLQSSPSLAAADARLRQAQAEAGAADASRKPTVGLSPGYTGIELPKSMVGDDLGGHYSGSAQVVMDFQYGVDLWGGKRAAWESAVDQVHAAEIDAQAARLDLSAAIAQAYTQLGYAWQQFDVASNELERANKTLELTRQRRSAGLDSDLQVRQAEGYVPAARQQVQAAQLQIELSRTALAALIGQGPDRGQQIARPKPLDPVALALPGVLSSDLLARRPDVVAARWRVESADKQIRSAKTKFYPSLNLIALGGLVNSDVGQLFKSSSTFALLAPSISLPIFDGGARRANLAKSDAQYDLAVADYNQKVVQALRDVVDQVASVRSLDAQAKSQDESLQNARAAYDLAQQRYRAGIGSYLQVLSVEQQLLSAEQGMAALQSQQVLASVKLQQALGGGFAPPQAADSAATTESKHS